LDKKWLLSLIWINKYIEETMVSKNKICIAIQILIPDSSRDFRRKVHICPVESIKLVNYSFPLKEDGKEILLLIIVIPHFGSSF
jgi:hypothetical protein